MINRYRAASIAAVSAALLSYTHIAHADSNAFKDHCSGAAGKYDAPLRGWYWTWENDVAGVVKSDSYYTQGAQVGYTFRKHANPNLLDRIASPLCNFLGFDASGGDDTALSASTVFLGQQLFTPKDKSTALPNPYDRPYAGWAYLGARLELLQPFALSDEGRRRWHTHSFEVQAGVVGSNALGEQTQRAFHDLEDSVQSNGWRNQIANRYAGQAFYNFSTRLKAFDIWGLSSDVLWDVGGAAGSLQNHISTGTTWRIGRNMGPMTQRAIQPSSIAASLHPSGATANERDTRKCEFLLHAQECYFFVGASAKGVNKNIFLEGASSGAGSEISAEELVYELTWGFRARYRWARFDYVSTTRSREFSPAPANPLERKGRHDFGSLTMSCYGGFGGYNGKLEVVCPGFVAAVASFLVFRD